jgi:hypothetical protein
MKYELGDRVGAICEEDNGVLRVFGYGVYAGEEVPTDDVMLMGMPYSALMGAVPNPKLVLDSGETVYGCECWWGPEESVRQTVEATEAGGKKIERITVSKYREMYK